MNILQPPHRRDVLLITLAALALRLVLLPWSQTVHADAVSRIHIAYEWMLDPHYIATGSWGPLHHYLNALFMMIFPGKVLGPNVLNILCASLTAIPLYGTALNLFGSRKGAVFAALIYVLSPIVIWTSLQALSEASYGLFLALGLFFLTRRPRVEGDHRSAIYGGVAMTCAAAIRYEAWVLIAVFALVLILQRNWRHTLVFLACAMLFPLSWMIGNQLEYGNALYGIAKNDEWIQGMEGINDMITREERVKRVVFFPWSFLLNISPFIALSGIGAFLKEGLSRRISGSQLVWLLPFVSMVVVMQLKAWEGSLSLHHRFVITWMILLLPFVPIIFLNSSRMRARMAVMVIGTLTLIPLAFFWNMVVYTRLLGDNVVGRAMEELATAHYREMEVVPRIHQPETDRLLAMINEWGDPGNGLVLDFIGWDRTYYLALNAEHHTMIMGGATHETYRPQELRAFLLEHPNGQIVFSRTGLLRTKTHLRDSVLIFEDVGLRMTTADEEVFPGLRRIAYHVIFPVDDGPGQMAFAGGGGIFTDEMDAELYETRIRSNEAWFTNVRRQAFWKGEPLDSAMRRNVEYSMAMDAGGG